MTPLAPRPGAPEEISEGDLRRARAIVRGAGENRSGAGHPPKQFLTALRLAVADILLAEGGAKVGDVARRVGRFDASHLSRRLRQRERRRSEIDRC